MWGELQYALDSSPPTNHDKMTLLPDQFLKLLSDPAMASITSPIVVAGIVDLGKWEKTNPPVKHIPKCQIRGSLLARSCEQLESLDCHVSGRVDVSGSGINCLGKNFSVGKHFAAESCDRLRSLRGQFGGDVSVKASALEKIPASVKIVGSLDVRDCRSLKLVDCDIEGSFIASKLFALLELGENFRCKGDVSLLSCMNLKVLGFIGHPLSVSLENSGVREVREDFTCRGTVIITSEPNLTSIGANAKFWSKGRSGRSGRGATIGNDLFLSGCEKLLHLSLRFLGGDGEIKHCPSLTKISAVVGGNLTLSQCGLEDLGELLRVKGDLIVEACDSLQSLAPQVGRTLEIRESPVLDCIREDLVCGRDVVVLNCPRLRTISGEIEGDLSISGPVNIPVLDKSLHVYGGLKANSVSSLDSPTCIEKIDTIFGGEVVLSGISLGSTGSSFECQSLYLENCLTGTDLRGWVRDSVTVKNCPIEVISAGLECRGQMKLESCPKLSKINCVVGGFLMVLSSLAPVLLRAFSCQGSVVFIGCVDREGKAVPRVFIPAPSPSLKS